jgi:hypothetical protein
MKTSSRSAILIMQILNILTLAGFAGVIVACVSCSSPEKRAHQEANYRARFERTSSIRMSELGSAHGDVTRHQFLPGAKVELYVSYFTRGEQIGFKVEKEDGTTVPVSGGPGTASPSGNKNASSSSGPGHSQLAYAVDVRHSQSGGVTRVDLPVQYSNRNLPGQPQTPSAGGFVHFTATFECPTTVGRYLVVLDCPDVPNMERLKTYPFSVVSTTLPSEEAQK